MKRYALPAVGIAAIATMVAMMGAETEQVATADPDVSSTVTPTAFTGISTSTSPLVAKPSITGPAPLPTEMQGLPG